MTTDNSDTSGSTPTTVDPVASATAGAVGIPSATPAQDSYNRMLISGPPHANPDPVDPKQAQANQDWLGGMYDQQSKVQEEAETARATAAASPTGDAKLDKIKAAADQVISPLSKVAQPPTPVGDEVATAMAGGQVTGPADTPLLPATTDSPDYRSVTPEAVEKDPQQLVLLHANSDGLPPGVQGYIMSAYARALKGSGGDPRVAYAAMLKARDDALLGPTKMTGWSDFPSNDPTPEFWKSYTKGLDDPNARTVMGVYTEARKGSLQFNDSSPVAAAVKALQIPPGPESPLDAFRTMQAYEQTRWPDGRPAAQSAVAGALGFLAPIAAALVAPAMALGTVGSMAIDQNLPASTPPILRDVLTTAPYAVGGGGPLAIAKRAVAFSAGVAGIEGAGAAASKAGVPFAGEGSRVVAPILGPMTHGMLSKQLKFLAVAEREGKLTGNAVTRAVNLLATSNTNELVGQQVVMGSDKVGTIAAVHPQNDTLDIVWDDGQQTRGIANTEVLVNPGVGNGLTPASEAERLRTKGQPKPGSRPLTVTPTAFEGWHAGHTYTPQVEQWRVLAQQTMPASLASRPDAAMLMDKFMWTMAHEDPAGDPSINNIAHGASAGHGLMQSIWDMTNDPATQLKEAWAMVQRNPEKWTDWGEGSLYEGKSFGALGTWPYNPGEITPEFQDLTDLAKGMADGSARIHVVRPIGGGSVIADQFSKEAQDLLDVSTDNGLDRSMRATALHDSAEPNDVTGWTRIRALAGFAPAVARQTTHAVQASANFAAAGMIKAATAYLGLKKVATEAFGNPLMKNPESRFLLGAYKGDAAHLATPHAYIIGTLVDAIDHPEDYNLTPKQAQAIEVWRYSHDYEIDQLKKWKVNMTTVDGMYMPLRVEDEPKNLIDRINEGKQARTSISGLAGSRSYYKVPGSLPLAKDAIPDMRQWADHLSTLGKQAETNPFDLYKGRMQSSVKIKADQAFYTGVAEAYGRPLISDDQQQLRDSIAKVRSSIQGRNATLAGQTVRAASLDVSSAQLEKLLADTEKTMDTASRMIGRAKPDGDFFQQLQGRIDALYKQADHIAFNYTLPSQMSTDAAKLKMANTMSALTDLKTKLAGLRDQIQPAQPNPGEMLLDPSHTIFKNPVAVPADIGREVQELTAPRIVGSLTTMASTTIDSFKSIFFAADMSAYTRHGLNMFEMDPVNFFKNFAKMNMAAMTPDGYVTFMSQNIDMFTKWAQSGLVMHVDANDVLHTGEGGLGSGRVPTWTPVLGQMEAANEMMFGRLIPLWKVQNAQSMLQMLQNIRDDKTLMTWATQKMPFLNTALKKMAGVNRASDADLMKMAADVANNIGGGQNWAKIDSVRNPIANVLMKFTLLNEGWIRANMGDIINATKLGDGRGVLARRFLMQQLAISTGMSVALSSAMSGRTPQFDPRANDFLDVQTGDDTKPNGAGSISIIPGKQYIKTIAREIGGTPTSAGVDQSIAARTTALLRLGEGRGGQLPAIGVDIATGKDYLGRNIGNPGAYVAKSVMPMAFQALWEKLSGQQPNPVGVAAQFAGMSYVPKSPFDARDKYISSLGYHDQFDGTSIDTYSGLSGPQQDDFNAQHPEYGEAVKKFQDERESPYAAATNLRLQHRDAVVALGMMYRGEPLTPAQQALLGPNGSRAVQQIVANNPKEYRVQLANLAGYYRGLTDKVLGQQANKPATSTQQQIISDYYTNVVDKSTVNGAVDYDMYDANERTFRDTVAQKYGQEGLAALDQEIAYRSTDDSTAHAYHTDQTTHLDPYYKNTQQFWTPQSLAAFGLTKQASEFATANFANEPDYKANLTGSYVTELEGKALPGNIGNLTIQGKTFYVHFGIRAGSPLNQEQAGLIAKELVTQAFKKYDAAIEYNKLVYLQKHPETACALSHWGYGMPTGAAPLLNTCTVR